VSVLARLQREFMRTLFEPQAPAAPGLAVYRSSVLANFNAALAAAYPVVRRLVGEPFFDEAARLYALGRSSVSGDLGDYGEGFAAFLSSYPHAASLDYLADVARLEWACHQCGRAPEPLAFDFDGLARVPAEAYGELRLELHPAVHLVDSPHPVAAIHAANAPGRDGIPERADGGDRVMVRRVNGMVRVEPICVHEWRFLDRISRGESLEAASLGAPPEFVEGALARYVADAIVCGFTAPRCAG
jgi:hypothetical protein